MKTFDRIFFFPFNRSQEDGDDLMEVRIIAHLLILNTQISVYIFSILSSIHLVWYSLDEFIYQSTASVVGDQFPFSYDLNSRFSFYTLRRN